MFSCLSVLGKSVLIVVLAAGLLTQFFARCAFAIRSFSKVSATPVVATLSGAWLHRLSAKEWLARCHSTVKRLQSKSDLQLFRCGNTYNFQNRSDPTLY